MKRIEAIECVIEAVRDETVISNLGFPSRELFQVHDRNKNFYMLGSMGLASSIGLGLALVRPKERIVVLDGDGSILMNLGSLVTIGNLKPANLLLIILDNHSYGTTGGQPSYTAGATSLAELAKAAGIRNVRNVRTKKALEEYVVATLGLNELAVAIVEVEKGNTRVPIIPLNPRRITERLMRTLKTCRSLPRR